MFILFIQSFNISIIVTPSHSIQDENFAFCYLI